MIAAVGTIWCERCGRYHDNGGTYVPPNCSQEMVRVVDRRVEVGPDLSNLNRHDRRTMEAIGRKYGWDKRGTS